MDWFKHKWGEIVVVGLAEASVAALATAAIRFAVDEHLIRDVAIAAIWPVVIFAGVWYLRRPVSGEQRESRESPGSIPDWLRKVVQADRENLASRVILDEVRNLGIGVAGLLREIEPFITFGVYYLNTSVFTLVHDGTLTGHVRFKGEELLMQPFVEGGVEIPHGVYLNLVIKVPLSESAAKAVRSEIDTGNDLTFALQGLRFELRAKEDDSLSPVKIRLWEHTFPNSWLRGNLWENGAKVIDGVPSASAGFRN